MIFIVSTINNLKCEKNQWQDKENSHFYDIDAVEFLDHLNFENNGFDDNEIDYLVDSI